MDFKHSTQEYFKFTIIGDLCTFLQRGLTSATIFHKNLTRFSYCQPYKIFKLVIIIGSIPNSEHLLLELKLLKISF